MRKTALAAVCGFVLAGAGAMAQTGADYLDITRVQVRADKGKEFEDSIKKLVEVNRKYKGDHWIAMSTEYGDFGGFSFSSTRENYAAVETGMGAFQKALKEGLGPMGDKLMRDISSYSASGYNQLRHRRWDLSVHPPSSAAELYKMVGQTRWIRTLRLDVKPGANFQYIDAWKPFQAELAKISPPVTVLVSESSTGTPAIFVAIYYKSWAEMDAGAAALPNALASQAYQNLMRVTQNTISMSNWEIHRLRPQLSYPPDEIASADPAFWNPKPAPPAAPKPKTTEQAMKK
ncbi:MAG TPA: hypothetical protein VE959_01510 [Bryobacteraceae bacterium]|nr:hypothetical protein [Bryobacteraceae bacterium]